MISQELKAYLDEKVEQYNQPSFIEDDPISIPHRFAEKEDIEIAAFLTATISWGNRKTILKSASSMMEIMGNSPYDFVMNHQVADLKKAKYFVHRTFNGEDFVFFIQSLRNIYEYHGGLEKVFLEGVQNESTQNAISHFKKVFFSIPHPSRTLKHISDPERGSAAKRINMMLRWLCRQDNKGVDFGIWKSISPAILSCPLDVHSGNVAREFGLIHRHQNDAKALSELDQSLRQLDPKDPVKYDFALFGIGVNRDLA